MVQPLFPDILHHHKTRLLLCFSLPVPVLHLFLYDTVFLYENSSYTFDIPFPSPPLPYKTVFCFPSLFFSYKYTVNDEKSFPHDFYLQNTKSTPPFVMNESIFCKYFFFPVSLCTKGTTECSTKIRTSKSHKKNGKDNYLSFPLIYIQ